MTEQAQLAELISRFQTAPPDIRAAMLQTATGTERKRPGTIREAAEILGVHKRTVQRLARRGLLHPIRITPRCIRWDLAEVERLATQGATS